MTSHIIQVKVSYPNLFTIPIVKHFNMLPLCNIKLGDYHLPEIIISLAPSGGRREIEWNSGSLPPIQGGLATLVKPLSTLTLAQLDAIKGIVATLTIEVDAVTDKRETCAGGNQAQLGQHHGGSRDETSAGCTPAKKKLM